jgi:uncharacterized membrane protein
MIYFAFKTLHILAVAMFLGNITTGIFWKAHADRTRNPLVIAHALEGIIHSDRWFTLPGVALIILGGLGAAIVGRLPILHTGWIFWGIVLFAISGLAFMLQVAPLQRRMAKLMRSGAEGSAPDWQAYEALSRAWAAWGLLALLPPLAALLLMVFKPAGMRGL